MKKILSIIKHLIGIRWKYLLYGSYVYAEPRARLNIGQHVKISRTKIWLSKNSSLKIADGVTITHALVVIKESCMEIGTNSLVGNGMMGISTHITVDNHSKVIIGSYNRICPQRIWVRFGGQLLLGNYVFLNEFSEIRCDELIRIGSYTTFSYNVRIWDTNTHEIMPIHQRHERCHKMGLRWRIVTEKPKTSPIVIGEDSWIGERSAILKGTVIGNGCICGFGTLLSNKTIPDKTTVFSKNEIVLRPNHL